MIFWFSLIFISSFFKIFADNSQHICSDLCSDESFIKSCECDHKCHIFGDCCQDIQKNLPVKNYECEIKLSAYRHVYSISKCPQSFTDENIKKQCEINELNGVLSILPVYSKLMNLTYKNVFCAYCNIENISYNELVTLEMDLSGLYSVLKDEIGFENLKENSSHLDYIIANYRKVIIFKDRLTNQRNCLKDVIDFCPHNSSYEEKRKCSSYTALRKAFGKIYKNEDCLVCNEIQSNLSLCQGNKYLSSIRDNHRKSLQILFDISDLNSYNYKLNIRKSFKTSNENLIQDNNAQNINQNNYINDTFTKGINNKTHENIKFQITDISKKYLTIIGLTISIISTLLLIVIYLNNKALRNFPGKLLICLSISLLFSQLSFLISMHLIEPTYFINFHVQNEFKNNITSEDLNLFQNIWSTCYIFGLLTHYFYLSFFLWSNILAFDLYTMLESLLKNGNKIKNEKDRRLVYYSIYGWSVPFILVVLLSFKQLIYIEEYLVYGINSCFISKPIDRLLFFILPVSILLMFNLYFLIRSIIGIKNIDRNTHQFLKKEETVIKKNKESQKSVNINKNNQNKNRIVLYFKLFFITGMSWTLGLICSFVDNIILWYMYIIFNSLQGLFIFLSFAFNSQTVRSIRTFRFIKILWEFNENSLKTSTKTKF